MKRTEQVVCRGVGVNERTQCAHYHSERDIIAIRFKCCGTFYACIQCHHETAGHAPVVWPQAAFDTEAILCGNCQTTLTIAEYLACQNTCPHCRAAFNPGCANHYPLYFEVA
ncbi:CHY zinc finger protein [uncultured Hymenobacter sp.]|uniref:CHY zinc finger protein n=1 Tax=uncultured Hymenobacter sp. TaxID=170016 RepID=UPI0035C9591E